MPRNGQNDKEISCMKGLEKTSCVCDFWSGWYDWCQKTPDRNEYRDQIRTKVKNYKHFTMVTSFILLRISCRHNDVHRRANKIGWQHEYFPERRWLIPSRHTCCIFILNAKTLHVFMSAVCNERVAQAGKESSHQSSQIRFSYIFMLTSESVHRNRVRLWSL